jgi:hypothetical protein
MSRVARARPVQVALFALTLLIAGAGSAAFAAEASDRSVILVTIDGMRWQEIFGGAQEKYVDPRAGGVLDVAGVRERFLRDSAEARREALMPFLWSVVAKQGQVFGDPAKGAAARVTNGKKFSYPGYQELLCGFPDARIKSNDKVPNPNVSVLEWLNGRPGFDGRVSAYGSWDVLRSILNDGRSRLPMVAAWELISDEPLTPGERAVNELIPEVTHVWHNNALDVITQRGALEHLKKRKPRVLYIMLGETDEWAHARRYDTYLDAAHNADRFLRTLWETAQSMPEYAGKTSLVITTDHGRGGTLGDWTNHGPDVPGAENIWIAAMGPAVPARGGRENVETTQAQVAATVASLVGEDYHAAVPQSASALPLGVTAAK